MKKEDNISRRDALKRMSKAAIAVAVASVFPSMNALAEEPTYSNYDNYKNYNDYYNYRDYKDYSNYADKSYSNYNDYKNYSNYYDCY